MQTYRNIELSFMGPPHHMVGDGFRVSQYFPSGKNLFKRFSPFLLLDYNTPFYFSPTQNPRGVGAHPHRGFETVTIVYDGKVEHHDNSGNHGVIQEGEVQWMTAGKGILHKEYHERGFSKQGGIFHAIQLWVDLPQNQKMTNPKYQTLGKNEIGFYDTEKVSVRVIAGEFKNEKGEILARSKAQTFSPINLYNIFLKKNASVFLSEPTDYNTGILVIKGEVKINAQKVYQEREFILFENMEGVIELESLSEDFCACVLSGKPLEQEVFARGPFVMSTQEDIHQAFIDYEEGKFGTWSF
ncbi:short-chain dehydrogenase [Helicobacter sp. 12S02232-10]|uniref:pirin family protein n=1 Tax=Helicobacter sp. 12S02232-10 TaxID=1476197 RepID=UPI000BA5C745|nr:pirin family protein [Helicobacter sp. 12S02232-10]PAF46889.1 short-chain dehydrogenase [Helicobacter sp. 12S02232-10]